ncbi:triose-phosphate isomerase [Desulfosediminicola ganghwensis]|uniref:triose-phosphate isomerase n=1 Tax=Desulfosediminicola ganghwensis TaxID=2569540 RepID=UPI0010AD0AD0|nr:triose-phosphate isomerase [Desulfosediminicola ganghwensis]
MSRKPLIAGNWKMHLTIAESVELARLVATASEQLDDREVMIAPAYTALDAVAKTLKESNVHVGSQNVAYETEGAFTGEISPLMLKDIGVTMPIIGHSERRQLFNESDALINKRVTAALKNDLIPVFCIGETIEEREAGNTFSVLESQLKNGLAGINKEQAAGIVIAYEPVWAIGTGKTASTEQAQETHAFIRSSLSEMFDTSAAESIRILYGGSVKPDNVDALMAQNDIDGALVGGAALKAESFGRIVNFQ